MVFHSARKNGVGMLHYSNELCDGDDLHVEEKKNNLN